MPGRQSDEGKGSVALYRRPRATSDDLVVLRGWRPVSRHAGKFQLSERHRNEPLGPLSESFRRENTPLKEEQRT